MVKPGRSSHTPRRNIPKKLIADIPRISDEKESAEDFSGVLLEARGVSRSYSGKGGEVLAVDNISFNLHKGKVLGIVGESGNGKSALARQLTRLETPDSGDIFLDGFALSSLRGKQLREL